MSAHAAPHALLIADWGTQGAALLSVPTREYLQSSGWVEVEAASKHAWHGNGDIMPGEGGVSSSVRTGSGFWADGRPGSGVTITGSEPSQWCVANTGAGADGVPSTPASDGSHLMGDHDAHHDHDGHAPSEGDSDSGRTASPTHAQQYVDPVGAHEAFVAGMVWSLSQRVLPGCPYTREEGVRLQGLGDATGGFGSISGTGLVGAGADVLPGGSGGGSGRWRLEECLRCVLLILLDIDDIADPASYMT